MTSESGPSGTFKSGMKQEKHRRGRSGHRKPQKPPEERLDYFAAGAEIKDENGIRCVEIGNRIGDWGCRHNAYDKDKLMAWVGKGGGMRVAEGECYLHSNRLACLCFYVLFYQQILANILVFHHLCGPSKSMFTAN